jgi:hypothetical protein
MKKIRTIPWCEKKILEVLKEKKEITTYLDLTRNILVGGVRSLEEQRNLNKAIGRLVFGGMIKIDKDRHGFRIYRLVE